MRKIFAYLSFFLIATISLSANTDITLVNLENIAAEDENFTLWIALFGLGAVGLIALFLSSEQLKNFKQNTQDKEESKSKMDQTQDQILSNMGENIQNIAQETVATAKKLATNTKEKEISGDLERVANSESKLLAITTNLIEFLRIKSKKVEIVNKELKLSNLLNDVSGTLRANTKDIELELIYAIKSNIPENLKGDTLNLSKVLVNLLLFCVENRAKEIRVEVSKNSIFNKDDNLYFKISSDIKLDVENSENIFNSNYNEKTNSYESLGLFIARELSTLMDGELIARNDKNGHIEFLFNIPFKEEKEARQTNTLIDSKKVLIVDSSRNSAIAIKEIFLELKHKAKVEPKKNYLLNMPDFSNYDVVIIDEKLFTNKAVAALKQSSSKVISLSNLFKTPKEFVNSEIADLELNKPLTKKQISETMKQLYFEKSKESLSQKSIKVDEKVLPVYKKTFEDTLNIELNKFAEFRGTNVLLVEDNLINQKVLIGVLSKSGMNITVANDGQEALDILNREKKFDIVFMDINMPIMDGYTATTKVRTDQKFNQLPIVALSALTSPSEVDKMFSCGMNGYLAKPLKKEKLFTVFTLFIKKRSKDRRANKREEKSIVSLDGLNVTLGISQSSSSEIFYKEILSEFKDAYGQSGKIFEKLVTDFRYEQLRMLCIDIKGLSGSIGAEDMHQLTTEILQKLLFKKYEFIPAYIQRYEEELNRITKSIDKYIV